MQIFCVPILPSNTELQPSAITASTFSISMVFLFVTEPDMAASSLRLSREEEDEFVEVLESEILVSLVLVLFPMGLEQPATEKLNRNTINMHIILAFN